MFQVKSMLSVELSDDGIGGIVLHEEEATPSYIKDYDAQGLAVGGEGITRWVKNFSTSNWTLFVAHDDAIPVGGATVAFQTPEIRMFGGRSDVTCAVGHQSTP
jgi:hypothetical protein